MIKAKGFTLIEVMIVVAVVAVLAAIALPSYTKHVLRSHRQAALSAIMDLSSRQARYYSANNSYTTSLTKLGYSSDPQPIPDATTHYYDLSAAPPPGGSITNSFVLSATPVGNQVNDTCSGVYQYTDLGAMDITAVTGGDTVATCWSR